MEISQNMAESTAQSLAGARVAFLGKLAGMSRRDAQQLIRQQGGIAIDQLDDSVQMIVMGEDELPVTPGEGEPQFGDTVRQAVDDGRIEVITETQLWQRLGLVEAEAHVRRLYTPAMLADLLDVPVAIVRRWHRRGLIVPTREVRRLPYFDFQEVATARRLAELLAAGMSPQLIEKRLAELARYVPSVRRPLAQLSIIVEGKRLLLRQGDGLVAPGGQLWFDFLPSEGQANETEAANHGAPDCDRIETMATLPLPPARTTATASTIAAVVAKASELDDEGDLEAAADMYRTALAAGGPNAELCFALAELLYRLGDVTAARERYFMAIELDEEYVEARANLGCVLAELGHRELAVAAFEGALAFHGEYPDVHYHLARTLDDLDRRDEAEHHWKVFVGLAPESPWAAMARRRLSASDDV
jgi:tetratricopeptide (TPR) repeat protein